MDLHEWSDGETGIQFRETCQTLNRIWELSSIKFGIQSARAEDSEVDLRIEQWIEQWIDQWIDQWI